MSYLTDDTWEALSRKVANTSARLVAELASLEELYQDTLAAFVAAGGNNKSLARVLYQLPRTPEMRLKVDSVTQTIFATDAAGNKLTGTGIFNYFEVGQGIKSLGFANGANNNAVMTLTAKPDVDTLKFGDQAGLVTETGSDDEQLQQQATVAQIDAIDAMMTTLLAGHELYGAMTNVVTATADRLALFRNFK